MRANRTLAWTTTAAAVGLILAGCSNAATSGGGGGGAPSGTAAAGTSATAAAPQLPSSCSKANPPIGVSLPNTVNPYYIAMRQSFLDNGKADGFDVSVAIANDSDSNQLSQVQAFIQQGVCAIALNGVNSGPAAASVAAANQAGIPVFTVNVIAVGSPIQPALTMARAAAIPSSKRSCWFTATFTPRSRAASTSSRPVAASGAKGFWQSRCLPASIAVLAMPGWASGATAMSTTATRSSASSSSSDP